MKKINLLIAGLTVVVISAVTSCKKDEVTNVVTPTPAATPSIEGDKANLTGKNFIMTAWTSSPAWYGVTDVFATTEACYKDNTIMYNADGTFTLDKGNSVACDSSTVTSGTWSFNDDATKLMVGTATYSILVNDGTTLKYTVEYDNGGTTLTWTYTFTKVTATQNLTGKTYSMTAWTSSPAWYGVTDVYAVTEDCYKDNDIIYNADGTFTIGTGALTACDTTATSGNWAFNSDETAIIVNDNSVYSILVNDGTTLSYTTPFLDTSVTPTAVLVWTYTFKKN